MTRTFPELLAAAGAIADQLADPHTVNPGGPGRRRPQSLAGGAAGIALLHIARARSGHAAWTTARSWLAAAARETLSAGPNANLYFGAPTLAFVTHLAADEPGKYARALAELDAITIALTRRRLDAAHARIDRKERPVLAEFDLIRGLGGLGSYHLQRHPGHDITRSVLGYLVRLTEPLPGRADDDVPGWWTEVSPNGDVSSDFPGGHGNLGMSHGIAGPLSVLALALRRGIAVDGHAEAIGRIQRWLDLWQQRDPTGPWWPGFITLQQSRTRHVDPDTRQRPSWCYGSPGLARAQQLAALAIGDVERQSVAEAAMLCCLRDPTQLDRLVDSGLCHGTAGVLQAAWRMSRDARTRDLAGALPALAERLLAELPAVRDEVEFLDGLAGIGLALHTVGAESEPATAWDACLLLT
ncbi:lanthionine synthetase C family protein [Amycolatopsis vastitatis]|uniref:Lantibiotic modifying enzyme n=1 Tax=Amycolatopsis vastitatis TaxID=1905142 RepID=A0A229SL08_9PSEU|nr:lanthionine synthetase C family protein [Amycolatopsis vastitatis]OXM59667.1 lantibiotic modifying enzyme [Amycolatopsis vastitatis]